MKKWIAILAIGLTMMSLSVSADAARRFGGGMSFGRSAPTLQKATPAPSAGINQQRVNPQQQQRQQQAAPAQQPRPQTAAPSPMRGMLMGLAAALGITALAHALGFGEGFAQFLMIALMALVAFYVIRMLLGLFLVKRRPAGMPGHSAEASRQDPMQSRYDYVSSEPQSSQSTFSGSSPMAGSVLDELNNPTSAQKVELPADFNVEQFLKVAEANFAKMQKAWDTGNVTSLSDFTTDEVFRTVTHQLRERGAQDYQTEIVTLKSDFRGIVRDGEEYLAGVHFDGTLNVSGEAERVDETWILTKPIHGQGGWLLAGIHQESEA